MVGPSEFESLTPSLSGTCSNQLSYGPRLRQHIGNLGSAAFLSLEGLAQAPDRSLIAFVIKEIKPSILKRLKLQFT